MLKGEGQEAGGVERRGSGFAFRVQGFRDCAGALQWRLAVTIYGSPVQSFGSTCSEPVTIQSLIPQAYKPYSKTHILKFLQL